MKFFYLLLDKVIIPEIIAIRLANNTEVSAKTFYEDIVKQLLKLQAEAQRTQPRERMNRSGFNDFLSDLAMQNDSPLSKKYKKKFAKKKKIQDDEDFNIDMESSGDKIVTTSFPSPTPDSTADLNDTTIIFDQEQED